MKPFLILALFSFVSFFSFAQTTGKSKIVLKDKTVLSNIKVWNIYSNKIEYEENESLHDLLTERIARIETDSAVLSFDENGQLLSRPYDWIIKATDDTVHCIISQLGGNYIYYYPKGRENRSYIPETSVKKYQIFKPEPAMKLEPGSAPFSPQVSSRDTLAETPAKNQADTLSQVPSTNPTADMVIQPAGEKKDSVAKAPDMVVKPNTLNEKPTASPLPVQSDLCYDSYIKGERDASRKSESAWGTGSFCLTGCLGAIPVATLSLIALNSKEKPRKIPEGVEEKCYVLGYQNQRAKRRVYNAAMGGLISSVVVFGVFYAVVLASNNGW